MNTQPSVPAIGSLEEQLCPADTWRNNNAIIASFFDAIMTSLLRRVSPGSRTSVKLRAGDKRQ